MLKAEEYIGSVGVGVTSPRVFRANDGLLYIVKLQRNRLGTKVLVNELLAAQMGERLNLCFPQGGIMELEAQIIHRYPKLARDGILPGKQFACRYLPHSFYVDRRKLSKAINKQHLVKSPTIEVGNILKDNKQESNTESLDKKEGNETDDKVGSILQKGLHVLGSKLQIKL